MKILRCLAVPAATVALVGCGAASAPLSDDQLADADAVVVTEGMRFDDAPTSLPSGRLTFVLVNEDRAPHDLTLEGDAGPVVSARGGGQALGSVELEPGTYTVYCSVGNHREDGMEFELAIG